MTPSQTWMKLAAFFPTMSHYWMLVLDDHSLNWSHLMQGSNDGRKKMQQTGTNAGYTVKHGLYVLFVWSMWTWGVHKYSVFRPRNKLCIHVRLVKALAQDHACRHKENLCEAEEGNAFLHFLLLHLLSQLLHSIENTQWHWYNMMNTLRMTKGLQGQ